MVRLKKNQRNLNLRKARSSPRAPADQGRRRCTFMNCLACLCVILNAFVISLSFLVSNRATEAMKQNPTNSNMNNNAAASANLRSSNSVQSQTQKQISPVITPSSGPVKYHFVFTSDCKDPTQDWQIYLFFHQFAKSKQEGQVTHIVTGCPSGARETLLKAYHEQHYEPMGRATSVESRFHVHFAPAHPKQNEIGNLRTHYRYFNRPYGIQHWMETAMGYEIAGNNPNDDTIIVVMERDMLMMRPFGATFNNQDDIFKKGLENYPVSAPQQATHGHPLAQYSPTPPNWWKDIPTSTPLPVEIEKGIATLKSMDLYTMDNHYSIGPPMLATAKDFHPLVQKWTEVTFPLYQVMNEKALREPHGAYSLAAASLGKPHQLANTFSVNNYRDPGFELFAKAFQAGSPSAGGTGAKCRSFPQPMTPHIVQYAKRYALGNYIIGKHYVNQKFLGTPESCSEPLYEEPPENVAEIFTYYKDPEMNTKINIEKEQHVHQMTFMLCETIQALNEAATQYKRSYCKAEPNLKKTKTFE